MLHLVPFTETTSMKSTEDNTTSMTPTEDNTTSMTPTEDNTTIKTTDGKQPLNIILCKFKGLSL